MGYNLITVIVTIFIYKRYYNHIKILEKEKNTWLNLKANTTDAAVEKHVPVVTQEGNKITVAVSSVEHPMLPEHYIMGVYIETKNGGQLHKFQPGDTPKATFTLADGDEFVAAYEYCNLHGLWKDK